MKTLYPALMSSFDDKYWNLSQAAAWVVYREIELVEKTAEPPYETPSMCPKGADVRQSDTVNDGAVCEGPFWAIFEGM